MKNFLLSFFILALLKNVNAQQANCDNLYLETDTIYINYADDTIVEGNLFYNDTVASFYPFIEIILEDTAIITSSDFMVLSSLDSGNVQFFEFEMEFKTSMYLNFTPVNAFFHIYDSDWPGDTIVNCYLPITIMLENFTTSIEEENDLNNFIIFPHPVYNISTLHFGETLQENCSVILYNSAGKKVRTITGVKGNELIIEKQNLENGIYFFRIMNENGLINSGKLIISGDSYR